MPNLHTYLHPRVKGMQNRLLPPLLRFIPQFAQMCIIFALSKFEANPFFRPVLKIGALGREGSLFENEKEIIMIIIINITFPIDFCPNSVNAGKEWKPECPDTP